VISYLGRVKPFHDDDDDDDDRVYVEILETKKCSKRFAHEPHWGLHLLPAMHG